MADADADAIPFRKFPCKTVKCDKHHFNNLAAGQCTRRYGPDSTTKFHKVVPVPNNNYTCSGNDADNDDYDMPAMLDEIDDNYYPLLNGDDDHCGYDSDAESDNIINDHAIQVAHSYDYIYIMIFNAWLYSIYTIYIFNDYIFY